MTWEALLATIALVKQDRQNAEEGRGQAVPFSDFPGYEQVTQVFRRIVSRGTYHPAYLFHGPSQMGKRRLAEAFASAIFCREVEGDFCGHCSACRRMTSGTFPDYRLIKPEGAYIKIDHTREMIGEAAIQPHEAPKKVFVLDPADRMRIEAANSLLKVLEEPFPFSIFILITSSPHAILPTIESRCQKIRFSPLPYEKVAAQLIEAHALEPSAAETLARLCGGRPGLAEELAKGDFLAERDKVIEVLASVGANRELEVFRVSNQVRGSRDAAQRFFQLLIPVLRDALLLRQGGDPKGLLNQDRQEEIRSATKEFTPEELLATWQDATESSWNLLQNASAPAQIERVLLQLCPVEKARAR